MEQVFEKTSRVETPARAVFAWLQKPSLLERLTPPWEDVAVVDSDGSVKDGARVVLKVKFGPFSSTWTAVHSDFEEDVQFRDTQYGGPFASWTHLHRVEAEDTSRAVVIDRIHYRLPFAPVTQPLAGWWIRGKLSRAFDFRHRVMQDDLEMAARYGAVRSLKVVIAGASGMVGKALIPFLKSQGHQVVRLVRGTASARDEVSWDPSKGLLDAQALKGVDVVINLSGENVASGRWTEERKARLRASRVESTRTLCRAIGEMKHRPFVMVTASGVGFYGDCGDERVLEGVSQGKGFLADVCREWEESARAVEEFGVRSVSLRLGVVLSTKGGVLKKLTAATKWTGGTIVGGGRQWMSWISIDDVLGVIYHSILDQRCQGAINAVAPSPVRQEEFARMLARLLYRPTLARLPKFVVKWMFGEMGEELLLTSARALPAAVKHSGYVFRHSTLEGALRHLLGVKGEGQHKAKARARRPRAR